MSVETPTSKFVALLGIYLSSGFDQERRRAKGSRYEELLEKFDGHLELHDHIALLSQYFAEFLCRPENFDMPWPGVIHYEIAEPLGEWLFYNIDKPIELFQEEYTKRFNQWVAI